MNRDAIRKYVGRDRDSVAALKQAYWVQRYRECGPDAPWQAAQALCAYMRAVRPDWPTAADREDDLRHHIELKRKLDRTACVLSRR